MYKDTYVREIAAIIVEFLQTFVITQDLAVMFVWSSRNGYLRHTMQVEKIVIVCIFNFPVINVEI